MEMTKPGSEAEQRWQDEQREDWMIMDDQYFSFEALSRIYSVKDLLKI